MTPKVLFRRSLFALVPLVAVLVIGEVGARLFWQRPDMDTRDGMGLAPHPTRIWTLDASEQEAQFAHRFRLDPNGLRMARTTGAQHRILTVGDSSIFGHGLGDEETLHAGIHEAFKQHGHRVDGLTIAMPGYTTEQSLRVLEEHGWGLEPDLLLLGGLWSDNDIEPISDREWLAQLQSPRQLIEWALRDSRLFEWVRFTLEPPPETSTPVTWGLDPLGSGNRRVSPTAYEENLQSMLLQAQSRQASAVVLVPCNRPLLSQETPETGWPWDAYVTAMEKLAADHNLPIVYGCEVAKAAHIDIQKGFLDEMHPTGALNRAYADAIAAALIERNWPTEPLAPR